MPVPDPVNAPVAPDLSPDLASDPDPDVAPELVFDRSSLYPGDRVCVALSGGADSVALLRAIESANRRPRAGLGVGLSAFHIHHGIRGQEADEDQAFVEQLCAGLDIPLKVQRVDIPARVSESGETIEQAARSARYEIFHDLIASEEAGAVLTAHTMDDQTETVLLKLLRGAWTEGLGGISPVILVSKSGKQLLERGRLVSEPGKPAGRILRPLLCTRRREVEAYLRSLGQAWREDSSNADPAFTRNRLRHQILPLLREFNPSLDQALSNLSELAREDEARWKTELGRVLPQLLLPGKPVRGGGRAVGTGAGPSSLAIEVERLRGLEPSLRRRVLRAAARQLGARISFAETSRLLALCGIQSLPTVGSKPGSCLRISGGILAERSVRELRLSYDPKLAKNLQP